MEIRMNRTVVKVVNQKDKQLDKEFWLQQSWQYRLTALELLRQQFYNYTDETAPRLQRVYRIIEQKRG